MFMKGQYSKDRGNLVVWTWRMAWTTEWDSLFPTTTPLLSSPNRMNPVIPFVIHETLPPEILEMIFEEHAKLEWEAPIINGQVCRFWREIILNTPRAWAYLEIHKNYMPSMGEVNARLHRSSPAPLHIDTGAAGLGTCQKLYDIFSYHHTRIASLRMQYCSQAFFEGQDFPCMRLLDVANWYPVQWGSMPKLQALRLSALMMIMVPLSELAPLEMLALSCVECTPVPRHSQSLTTLMLNDVHLVDEISGPVNFPCLTYLSLSSVRGLKPHVNAPRLVIYHEERFVADESFNMSLPSLVEYGIYHPTATYVDAATWHLSFPNIQRLAIRADDFVLLSFFTSLANQPHSLPALQMISAGGMHFLTYQIEKRVQEKIESLVLVRNEACNGNIVLCIETVAPFQIPLYFGAASDITFKWICVSLTHILDTGSWLLKTFRSQVLTRSHSSPKL